MWCTNCQQDVPAIAQGNRARCASCGRFLVRGRTESESTSEIELQDSAAIDLENLSLDDIDFADAPTSAAQAFNEFDGVTSPAEPKLATDDADWLLDAEIQRLRCSFNLPDTIPTSPISAQQSSLDSALANFANYSSETFAPSAGAPLDYNTLHQSAIAPHQPHPSQQTPAPHQQPIHSIANRESISRKPAQKLARWWSLPG